MKSSGYPTRWPKEGVLTAGLWLAGMGMMAGSLVPYFPPLLKMPWMLELGTCDHVHFQNGCLLCVCVWGDAFSSPMAKRILQ